jgi:hypothetical protein
MTIYRFVCACITFASLSAISGCASSNSTSSQSAPSVSQSATALAGEWSMDLSPAQDRSYEKALVIIPAPTAENRPHSFTGTVYGGSAYDNGLVFADLGVLAFSMVSDEAGQMGGPYYWLGTLQTDGTLRGRVQSLSRAFELDWSARRAPSSN